LAISPFNLKEEIFMSVVYMDKRDDLKAKLNDLGIELNDYYQRVDNFKYDGEGQTFGNVTIMISMTCGTINITLSYCSNVIIEACSYKIEDIKDTMVVAREIAEAHKKLSKKATDLVSPL